MSRAAKPAGKLHLVVPFDAKRCAVPHHAHDDAQNIWRVWAAIDEIPNEYGLSALGRRHRNMPLGSRFRPGDLIAEADQQSFELARAAMDVADDIEGSSIIAPVDVAHCLPDTDRMVNGQPAL